METVKRAVYRIFQGADIMYATAVKSVWIRVFRNVSFGRWCKAGSWSYVKKIYCWSKFRTNE